MNLNIAKILIFFADTIKHHSIFSENTLQVNYLLIIYFYSTALQTISELSKWKILNRKPIEEVKGWMCKYEKLSNEISQ